MNDYEPAAAVTRRVCSSVERPSRTFSSATMRKRFHALLDGELADFLRAGALDDQFADFIGHGHGFDDGQAAGVAGILAALAAAPAIERGAVEIVRINAQVLEHFVRDR